MLHMEREEKGVLSTPLKGLGERFTSGYTRKLLAKAREELMLEVFQQAVVSTMISKLEESAPARRGTSFLHSTPGPQASLPSMVFRKALATLLSMPSRACLGEDYPGHWTDRHNAVQQELASLCSYAGVSC